MYMMAIGADERDRRGWDSVVLISDLPRRIHTRPVVGTCNVEEHISLVSVPALGGVRLRHRAADLIVDLLRTQLRHRSVEGDSTDNEDIIQKQIKRGNIDSKNARSGRIGGPVESMPSERPDVDRHLVLRGVRGRARLLAGLVRANRPWSLVPSLSPAIAAASAGAAFGIFYHSMWQLADALSATRLVVISVLAVTAMTSWLLLDNILLDRRTDHDERAKQALFNAVTMTTVAVAVILMYAVLYVAALVSALVVIPDSLLQERIGHPAGFADFAEVAWLAASIGTVAGALGSGLASAETVRLAAYGHRERVRRVRDEEDDSASS